MRSTDPMRTGDMLCHLCGMYSSGPWHVVNGKFICKICYDEGKCNPVRVIDLSSVSTTDLMMELGTREGVTKYPKWVTSDDVFGFRETFPGDSILIRLDIDYLVRKND